MRKFYWMPPLLLGLALSACASETQDSLKSAFDSGVSAYDAGEYAKAYRIWSSIDEDDLAAMRNVAMMRRQGLGTTKNPKGAEDMFERVAETGLPMLTVVDCQADLADMLIKGEAGPPDPEKALPLLVAAAAAHHPTAEYELAQFYEAGELVPKNLTVARNLYAAAANQGVKGAAARLAQLGPAPTSP